MKRIRATVKYLGKNFWGWQIQPDHRTVQGEIQRALKQITGINIKVIAAGRTDRGVHALGQVIHFDIPLHYPLQSFQYSLNSVVDKDIYISILEQVHGNFHSQKDAVERRYLYLLNRGNYSPFNNDLVWRVPFTLNAEDMKSGAEYLIGRHDFTSFVIAKSSQPSNLVDMKSVLIKESGHLLIFIFRANRFLHKMIRTIIGTLVDIGRNKRSPQDMKKIMSGQDRVLAGETAPAKGLYLYQVLYPDHFNGINSKFKEIEFSNKNIMELFFK